MINEALKKACEYERKKEQEISSQERPVFHLSPRVGWMNDPNGFSYYDGKYHDLILLTITRTTFENKLKKYIDDKREK